MPDPDARHSFLRPLAYWIFVTLALIIPRVFILLRKLTLIKLAANLCQRRRLLVYCKISNETSYLLPGIHVVYKPGIL